MARCLRSSYAPATVASRAGPQGSEFPALAARSLRGPSPVKAATRFARDTLTATLTGPHNVVGPHTTRKGPKQKIPTLEIT